MNPGSLRKQKGIAGILIVLLISLALGATALGIVSVNRNTQAKQVAVHAAAHASNDVWAAANALRLYLKTVPEADLLALEGNTFALQISGDTIRSINATILSVAADTAVAGSYLLNTRLVSTDQAADASAVLEAVYRLKPGDENSPVVVDDTVNLAGGLEMTGGITIIGSDGSLEDLSVDGNLTIDQISINDVRTIKSTGDVNLGSQVKVENVFANGDVNIKDSVHVDNVQAMGDFTASQGSADNVRVNGDVTITSSGTFGSITNRGDITVDGGGTFGSLIAGDDLVIKNVAQVTYGGAHDDASVNTWNKVVRLDVQGDLVKCTSLYWTNFSQINVGGLVNFLSCPQAIFGNHNVTVPVMQPVTEITLTKVIVDVWTMKPEANYVLTYNDSAKRPEVKLYNINGVPNGTTYYLNRTFKINGSSHYGYLCTEAGASGSACSDTSVGPAICLGFSEQNDCLSYDATTKKWTFSGTALAPGVMWFDGDLSLSSATTTTTIMATGSITTSGAFYGAAVNFVGYDDICTAVNSILKDKGSSGMLTPYKNRFAAYYPTNLCNISGKKYIVSPVGNIGLASGGYDPDADGAYSGGDIDIGAMSEIWGSVLAGDIISTGGETQIHGVLTSAALGDGKSARGTSGNTFGGSTTVKTTETENYSGDEVPDQSQNGNEDGSNQVSLLWVRYG